MLDLLSPRFIQLGDFPHQLCNAGTIFLTDDLSRKNARPAYWYRKYPLLFRELKWWEYRKPEELPEYLRFENSNKVIKVKKGSYNFSIENHSYCFEEGHNVGLYLQFLQPATKEEYETYMGISQGTL